MTSKEELQHELGNAKAEAEALKSMLGKAADRLEEVVESKCADDAQDKALATAARLRTAIERTGGASSS
jgi:hypothetical protein